MLMKRTAHITALILCILIIIGTVYFYSQLPFEQSTLIKPPKIPPEATLLYPSEYNFRQSINNCGPYSAAAIIRIINQESTDSEIIAKNLLIRLPNGYTLPTSLEKELRKHNINVRGETFTGEGIASSVFRIDRLMWHISLGHPIILLGKEKGAQHYITLLGYHKDATQNTFDVYDSWHTKGTEGLTVDDNGDAPGNRTLTQQQLLDFWSGGGMYGFYEYYAITVLGKIKE